MNMKYKRELEILESKNLAEQNYNQKAVFSTLKFIMSLYLFLEAWVGLLQFRLRVQHTTGHGAKSSQFPH